MRWTRQPPEWRLAFALFPVEYGRAVIWLEFYWRRWHGECYDVRPLERPA